MTFEKLIKDIKEFGGEMYVKSGDIQEIHDDVYVDNRIIHEPGEGIDKPWNVKPLALHCNYLYYVCPDCGKLHSVHKSKVGMKTRLDCSAKGKRKSERHMLGNDGSLIKIKRPCVIVQSIKVKKAGD